MFCRHCGNKIQSGSAFCSECGKSLSGYQDARQNQQSSSAYPDNYAYPNNYAPPQFYSNPPKKKRKWPLVLIVAIVALIVLVIVFGDDSETPQFSAPGLSESTNPQPSSQTPQIPPVTIERGEDFDGTWAIYWYLCGSDLESEGAFASSDLEEMMRVRLPDNISVVIETGGAKLWHNGAANSNTRYLYDSSGLTFLEQLPSANMGDSRTLEDFLRFCNENYPADRQAVIFWNHGGGSVAGVAFDERYGFDSLTLPEIRRAFEAVNTPSKQNPPYELIGFDACVMATIDVAEMLSGIGRYMVASQEWEPAIGWDYEGLLKALADDPGMSGAEFGKVICDTYYAACKAESSWFLSLVDDITLSVVDLTRIDALMAAYYDIGAESLIYATVSPSYFSEYGRAARNAVSYGGNNSWYGYTNMVDLGDLVRQAGDNLLPEYGQALLNALADCVIYQVTGPLRTNASGLSKYYNLDGDYANFQAYTELRDDDPFHWFFEFLLTGSLSAEGERYVLDLARRYSQAQEIRTRSVPNSTGDGLDEYPLIYTNDGYVILSLGSEIANKLTGVYCHLAFYDVENDIILMLGRDSDLDVDWESGVFMDNFRGVWGSIDGHIVYMELTDESENYQLFSVPVLLGGEEFTLRVSYSYDAEEYMILGARRGIDENGMSDRNLRPVVPGDVIEPLHYVLFDMEDEDEDFSIIAGDRLIVTANTRFTETELGDGLYIFLFEMVDALNNSFLSEPAMFSVDDGEIYLLFD